jgi:hypothetical protein
VVIVADYLTVTMKIDERGCSLAINIEAAGNGDITIYGNEIVARISGSFSNIFPGEKDEGKDFWLVQDGILSLLSHVSSRLILACSCNINPNRTVYQETEWKVSI